MRVRGLSPIAPAAYGVSMLDGRTAIAKHTKWVGFLIFGILALTVFLEGLG